MSIDTEPVPVIEESQYFVSACVVRQAAKAHLPDEMVAFHLGVLEQGGFSLDKIRFGSAEDFRGMVEELRAVPDGLAR